MHKINSKYKNNNKYKNNPQLKHRKVLIKRKQLSHQIINKLYRRKKAQIKKQLLIKIRIFKESNQLRKRKVLISQLKKKKVLIKKKL